MKNELLEKIGKMEKLLLSLKADVVKLGEVSTSNIDKKKITKEGVSSFSEKDLVATYNTLYGAYINNDYATIVEFVVSHTKKELLAFCKQNHLPIDVNKSSKEKIASELLQLIKQSEIISR